ncbi:hypothetical protein [Kordia jejudonensis]|uniref:hypothetical protein n=1 Tax=Kordia jejudonensis TaxID=1348245 RepID=UPI000629636A|nr:hypothetical protein [Kordia jejudonensis]
MKNLQRIAITTIISFLLIACFGDKNTVIGQEFGDTSFINKDFTGNKVAFSALPKNMCTYISETNVMKHYPDAKKMLVDDGLTFQSKSCRFLVYMDDQEYNYLSGSIFAAEDVLAEGEKWEETWELKKMTSKSSEYITGLGKTAIWIGKKRELLIKMEGYTITIMVPGSTFKNEEVAKNRDYKKIGIAIAKSTGLF